MLEILKPDETVDTIYDINLQSLYNKGYRNIILDMDNTITPWNTNKIPDSLKVWVGQAKQLGFSICLLSNNKQQRVRALAQKLDILAAPGGGKPLSRAFKRAIAVLNGQKGNTIVIGDQILTDILGGNRMNLYTILVNPLSTSEFPGTRITRWVEKVLTGRR